MEDGYRIIIPEEAASKERPVIFYGILVTIDFVSKRKTVLIEIKPDTFFFKMKSLCTNVL